LEARIVVHPTGDTQPGGTGRAAAGSAWIVTTTTSAAIRVAAAGDVHCHPAQREEAIATFAELEGEADLVLLAGDLTNHGTPEEARVVADACRDLSMPIYAVLGNHDWHVDRTEELVAIVGEAGVCVLERGFDVCTIGGSEVGVVGTKGFVGGFVGSHLPDFGEPLLREVYAETGRDVEAVDAGLRAVAACSVRLLLLHYAPTADTLVGEPEAIWTFLGTDRLAAPIAQHAPDLVVHGHAHAGRFEARIGTVPVHNVSVPVMRRAFSFFEIGVLERPATSIR
jgi:Icc-related predicted phosphoesterase